MFRRSAVSVFALVVAFALGMILSNRPATVSAQPAAGRGKCVGISVVHKDSSAYSYRVFRAFEDGEIEVAYVANNDVHGPWKKVKE